MTTDQTAADRLVAEARRAVHESLTVFSAPEADRLRALIADLETAVEGRTAIRMTAAVPVPPPADQTAVLLWAADELGRMDYDADNTDYGYDTYRDAWNGGVMDAAALLRRMAAEEQPAETAEDPARIDRLRPEFTEHASVESIDAQLRRARSQQRRWHRRVEWLTGLRQARVEQMERGARPAVGEQPETQEAP